MPTEIERAPSLTEQRITRTSKTSPPRHTAVLVLVLAIALAAIAGGWAWYLLRTGRPPNNHALGGLQVFGTLPDFTLIERDRRNVTRSDLLGTVWVANFIYTRCTDTCPLQSARMAVLQRDFAEGGGAIRRSRWIRRATPPQSSRSTPPATRPTAVSGGFSPGTSRRFTP